MVVFHAQSHRSFFRDLNFVLLEKMVSKVEKRQEWKKSQNYRKYIVMQCSKSTTPKFKRSMCYFEDDGVSSAILLLACIACSFPSYL